VVYATVQFLNRIMPMMKLGLMKRFFDTVSPDWRSPLLDEIATPWSCCPADEHP
jgi:hypothetical protein